MILVRPAHQRFKRSTRSSGGQDLAHGERRGGRRRHQGQGHRGRDYARAAPCVSSTCSSPRATACRPAPGRPGDRADAREAWWRCTTGRSPPRAKDRTGGANSCSACPPSKGRKRRSTPTLHVSRLSSRVLVVDDNVDTAEGTALSKLLKLLGHDVMMAHDGGKAAIEAARAHRPEICAPGHRIARHERYMKSRASSAKRKCWQVRPSSPSPATAVRTTFNARPMGSTTSPPSDYDSLMNLFAR